MENAFTQSTNEVLSRFSVTEHDGLSDSQIQQSREKHGPNGMRTWSEACRERILTTTFLALPEEPPTPIWEMILEQFKDQLVLILLGSAGISFVLALFESEGDWTAFVDPVVVCGSNSPEQSRH
jgi:Ca2+ transporting ATPase